MLDEGSNINVLVVAFCVTCVSSACRVRLRQVSNSRAHKTVNSCMLAP